MKRLLKEISKTPRAWVRLAASTWSQGGFELRFTVSAGKNGRELDHWLLRVCGVQEYSICDVNGGGIQMSDATHPAVRQFVDPACVLNFIGPAAAPDHLLGQLWRSHVTLVNDWIPIDRYLPTPTQLHALLTQRKGELCRGPEFLIRGYASALKENGCKTTVVATRRKSPKPGQLELLHFGNSYVIGEQFVASKGD